MVRKMPFYILYLFASDSSFKFVFTDVCRLLYILCRGGKEDVFAVATFLFSRFLDDQEGDDEVP